MPEHNVTPRLRVLLLLGSSLGLAATLATPARADSTIFDKDGIRVSVYLETGEDAFYLPNDNFGAGSYSRSGSNSKNVVYGEAYAKPGIDASYSFGSTSIYGGLSAVGAIEIGQDAEQFPESFGNSGSVELEDAFIGLKTKLPFGGADDTMTISGGRQPFRVDDGFLIGKGTYSAGQRAAWWYAPRVDFNGPGIISFNGDPVRADVFVLENNSNNDLDEGNDRPQTSFAGFDVTYFLDKPGKDGSTKYANRGSYVTLTYFNVYDADTSSYYNNSSRADRQGENVYSVSIGGTFVPISYLNINKDFHLYGQYVGENNSSAHQGYQSVDANAYYIEPGYTFSTVPWTPMVYYRYTNFSGNKDPDGTVKHSYDTMFLYNGSRNVYGGFFPGEVVGEYDVALSNLNVHQVGVTVQPPVHILKKDDSLQLDFIYYSTNFDHPSGAGLAPDDKHYADEFDVAAEYTYSPSLSGALLFGAALPGRGGEDANASYELKNGSMPQVKSDTYVLEAYVYKRF